MTTSQPMAFDAEKESLVLDAVERFVEREIKPVAQRLEHADEWPADIVAGMREMGLVGCIIREEYGGLGLSAGLSGLALALGISGELYNAAAAAIAGVAGLLAVILAEKSKPE